MVKRLLALTVLMVYLVTSAGFAMSTHYCGKKLSSVSINKPVKSCCKSVSEKEDKCCKNKHVEVRISDQHAGGVAAKVPAATGISLFIAPVNELLGKILPGMRAYRTTAHSPPAEPQVPLTIRNCVFRI